jgi:hypothetical protein
MLDHVKRHPDKSARPRYILWDGRRVQTSDALSVPSEGVVQAEFIHVDQEVRQGFDLKVDGAFRLANGDELPVLRTWKDDRFEDVVEYPFFSRDGRLFAWNVYVMSYPSGEKVEQKWTENAGFWVELVSEQERVYHCSHGMANPPDFNALVFRVAVRPA